MLPDEVSLPLRIDPRQTNGSLALDLPRHLRHRVARGDGMVMQQIGAQHDDGFGLQFVFALESKRAAAGEYSAVRYDVRYREIGELASLATVGKIDQHIDLAGTKTTRIPLKGATRNL